MANEILHSSMETDLRMASKLAAMVKVLLADNFGALSIPTIEWMGSVNGSQSDTHGIPYAGLDADDFASATEVEDVANTALTDSSTNIAVARYGLVRSQSDLATLTALQGGVNPRTVAESYVRGFQRLGSSLVGTAIATASTNVGTPGVNASVDDWFAAIAQLQSSSVPAGEIDAILHPQQFNDLQASIRTEGGAIQYKQDTQDMLSIKGQGYAGSFAGVDIFLSTYVTAAGGNREGAMFGRGALGWMSGDVVPPPDGTLFNAGRGLAIEYDRAGTSAETKIVGHAYLGVSLLEQARIVGIVTDQ